MPNVDYLGAYDYLIIKGTFDPMRFRPIPTLEESIQKAKVAWAALREQGWESSEILSWMSIEMLFPPGTDPPRGRMIILERPSPGYPADTQVVDINDIMLNTAVEQT